MGNMCAECGGKLTLPCLDLSLELARRRSRLGKDGSSITILVGIHNSQRIIESIRLEAYEYRTKDFFSIEQMPV